MSEKSDIERLLLAASSPPRDPLLGHDPLDVSAKIIQMVNAPLRNPYLTKESAALEKRRAEFYLRAEARKAGVDLDRAETRLSEIEREKKRITRERAILDEIRTWYAPPFLIGQPNRSKMAHLFSAIDRDWIYRLNDGAGEWLRTKEDVNLTAQSILVASDWSAIVKEPSGEVMLPFEVTAFEFLLSGRPLIVVAGQKEPSAPIECTEFIWVRDTWCSWGCWTLDDAPGDLHKLLASNIRAICIALDADVLETVPVRAPHSGQTHTQTQLPSISHHIVSLARRHHSASRASAGTGRPKRLHFRRGHWRHFPTFKVWVKWCLVGNPDLGFIEKEYRA